MKNRFEDKQHIHIPGNSFSSSILNESFEVLKNIRGSTLDEDISSQTRNLLIKAPFKDYNQNKHSESSLSPKLRQSDKIISPLYSLNSSKARTDKYKSHLL